MSDYSSAISVGWAESLDSPTSTTPVVRKHKWRKKVTLVQTKFYDEAVWEIADRERDGAVLPGELATEVAVGDEEKRQRLLELVRSFLDRHHPLFFERDMSVTEEAVRSARVLLHALPRGALPKVNVDGDGGVVMAWEQAQNTLLVVVDAEGKFHAVARAGTQQAEYHDDLSLEDDHVPPSILNAIPAA